MAAKKFVIDSQTLTQALWFIVPGGLAYGYAYFNTEAEGERIQKMEQNSESIITSARKGTSALAPIFKQRQKDGKFSPEMEQKLDDLLRAGNKKRVRVNADNETFHTVGKVESDDWRAGLKGGAIIKEQKRQRKLHKKKLRKEEKQRSLLMELMELRTSKLGGSNDNDVRIRRKEAIKLECKKRGIDYNVPWQPLVAVAAVEK
jgi:hypothetical protein